MNCTITIVQFLFWGENMSFADFKIDKEGLSTAEKTMLDIEKLESQILSGNLPDIMYLKKTNLLAKKYAQVEDYKKSDMYSLLLIEDGTEIAHMYGGGEKAMLATSLIREGYFRRAQRHLDDYMIACEWNRIPNARFYLPRRKVLQGQHGLIDSIQNFMDDDNDILLSLSMPPGTGKSTIIKFLLAYICGRYPLSMNMYVSYSDGMVKMIMDSVEAILTDTNEYCHNEIFNPKNSLTISKEYNTISYRRKGDFPTIGLVSLGGSVTGRTRANKFLITDDLVKNAEQARNRERMEKLNADYKATLTTRMIGDNVKQIMLGTIWSAQDPISVQIRDHGGQEGYNFIRIPVENENGESNFLYDHPDRYTEAKIAQARQDLDPVDFSCLMMQTPIERVGRLFPEEELQFYNGTLPDDEPDAVVSFTDVAWGGGDSLSMPIAYIYGDSVYIHDVVFDKGDKKVTRPRVAKALIKHKVMIADFEANNGGDEYAEDIDEMIYAQLHYRPCTITTHRAPGNTAKAIRIEQQAPVIKDWFFLDKKHRSKEYDAFMKEVCAYNIMVKVPHDDAPDSCAGLANLILHHMFKSSVTKRKRIF